MTPPPPAASTTISAAPKWHASTPDAGLFPPAFLAFLAENAISIDNYSIAEVLRFVRLNPRSPQSVVELERLRQQLGPTCEPVPWLPGFFSLSSAVKIASTSLYTESHIYGIDAASGAAVVALGARPGEAVLDVCCAPGAKLCMLADAVGPAGSVTGVDVAQHRLAACRTLCGKYGLCNVRLFLGDATNFCEPPPPAAEPAAASRAAPAASEAPRETAPAVEPGLPAHDRRAVRSKRVRGQPAGGAARPGPGQAPAASDAASPAAPLLFFQAAALRSPAPSGPASPGYDRVLVDAECTHDGSVKHLCKYADWGWETFEQRFLEPTRLATLEGLQRGLLRNAFAQLRAGGCLVYSTCSFARRQNEDVVEWLLALEPRAYCVPIAELAASAPCRPGWLEHTVRFEPCSSRTSALFIAKVCKRSPPGEASAEVPAPSE